MRNFNKNSIPLALVFSFAFVISPIATLAASPASVNLGTAGNFAILTKTGVSTTGSTAIVGDIGVSPISASAVTGFALTLPAASAFSTSASVTGKVYASDYAVPTPANLTTAISDMQTAYTDAMGRAPDVTELGAGNIGGLTLAPGVYKWGTGLTIPTDVTLSGSANDVWIFQIAQTLTVSSGAKIILSGGAQANNVFWAVAGQTTIGTTAVFNGNILDQTAIVLNTGATLNGRALAQTAVTLDTNAVTVQTSSSPTPAIPATPAVPAVPATGAGTSTTPATPAIPAIPATPVLSDSNVTALQAQLNGLLGTAQSLQAQVQARQQLSPNANPASALAFGQQVRTIARTLGKGSVGNDVMTLQQFLISQNKGPSARALATVGPTTYFGSYTHAALSEFQLSAGIGPTLGNFGPITRGYVSANY